MFSSVRMFPSLLNDTTELIDFLILQNWADIEFRKKSEYYLDEMSIQRHKKLSVHIIIGIG